MRKSIKACLKVVCDRKYTNFIGRVVKHIFLPNQEYKENYIQIHPPAGLQ